MTSLPGSGVHGLGVLQCSRQDWLDGEAGSQASPCASGSGAFRSSNGHVPQFVDARKPGRFPDWGKAMVVQNSLPAEEARSVKRFPVHRILFARWRGLG